MTAGFSVNEFAECIPLLKEERWLRHQENAAKPPLKGADGEGVNELAGERLNSPFKELEITRLPPRLSNPFAVRGIAVYGIGVPGCELQAWQRRFRHKADEW